MPSSINLFNTGKSGLYASRSALNTTGHNIANVNTEGFSRQRVEQANANPQVLGNVVFGSGVRVAAIQRVNDEFLTRSIGNEMKLFGQHEEKELALAQVETTLNEINGEGMNRLLARFFNGFRKLGNEPESEALRTTAREAADQLAGEFRRIARSLDDIQRVLDTRINGNVVLANQLIQEIADLNDRIRVYELGGSNANDMHDQRDVAVKKLSTVLDVSVGTNEKGDYVVSLTGVAPLVVGKKFNKLKLESTRGDPANGRPEGTFDIHLENFAPPNITPQLKNGRLGGLLEARDKIIAEVVKRMDELAFHFATKVNEAHRQGYALNGNTGLDFFKQPISMVGAAMAFNLSDAIRQDANNIATALVPDSPGDNRLTQKIISLQYERIMSGGTITVDDHYNSTVAELASVTHKNKQLLEHEKQIISQLERLRESISGVSLDEETTNLVQFQHAFDAAAKVIKVADEMLDTILNLRR